MLHRIDPNGMHVPPLAATLRIAPPHNAPIQFAGQARRGDSTTIKPRRGDDTRQR